MQSGPLRFTTGKILVIDDSPFIQRAAYSRLRDHGFKLLTCGNLTEALMNIRLEKPDVILLDINFPDQLPLTNEVRDGFWTAGWLKRMAAARDIPVILISGDSPATAEPRAQAAGAVAYFQKPFNHDALLSTVEKLMASKKPQALSVPVLKITIHLSLPTPTLRTTSHSARKTTRSTLIHRGR
jgi:CheY-like chemotaxis protein